MTVVNESSISADVVVVGSGVSASGAAIAAVRAGARVVMLEKRDEWGGSAALSAGGFWTFRERERYAQTAEFGERDKQYKVYDGLEDAVRLIESLGVAVFGAMVVNEGTGAGYKIDVVGLMETARRLVVESGGRVLLGTPAVRLIRDEERVAGVVARLSDGREQEVRGRAVVLATGGFQGDRELLSRYIGPAADYLLVRSNPGSVGDGLRLSQSAGAATSKGMAAFYGHLIPYPLNRFEIPDFRPLTQYHSVSSVLIGSDGRRLADERRGDPVLAQALLRAPDGRGALIFDDHVRNNEVIEEPFPGLGVGAVDRLQLAIEAGARYAVADTIEDLAALLGEWGFDSASLERTLTGYIATASSGGGLASGVPVSADARAPQTAPFHALAVQSAITFPHGGIRTSLEGEVVDRDGRAVPGLYASGSDIGGISFVDYAGGLAPGFITGTWAGAAASAFASGPPSMAGAPAATDPDRPAR
ncbi:FAD-binding protein [Microbacterium sp. NPDC077663]|uniref:FAD-binding protein n=1 Tax=Microbacterium sp. NPDC077663 TaxID=3364189 RepID=UPI0037C649D8